MDDQLFQFEFCCTKHAPNVVDDQSTVEITKLAFKALHQQMRSRVHLDGDLQALTDRSLIGLHPDQELDKIVVARLPQLFDELVCISGRARAKRRTQRSAGATHAGKRSSSAEH